MKFEDLILSGRDAGDVVVEAARDIGHASASDRRLILRAALVEIGAELERVEMELSTPEARVLSTPPGGRVSAEDARAYLRSRRESEGDRTP